MSANSRIRHAVNTIQDLVPEKLIPRNRNSVAFSNAIKILLRIVHFSDMKLKYLKEFPLNNFLNSLKYNSYRIILQFIRSANSSRPIN